MQVTVCKFVDSPLNLTIIVQKIPMAIGIAEYLIFKSICSSTLIEDELSCNVSGTKTKRYRQKSLL